MHYSIPFNDFQTAYELLKKIKKGKVIPSYDVVRWVYEGDLNESEYDILIFNTPLDYVIPTSESNACKNKTYTVAGLEWCLPDRWAGKIENKSEAQKICNVSNEQKLFGYNDWRLPTIFELSSFDNSDLIEEWDKKNDMYWTSNRQKSARYGEGVLGRIGKSDIINQHYHDGKIQWSSTGRYAGFDDSYYHEFGQVVLVRGNINEGEYVLEEWMKVLSCWAIENDLHQIPHTRKALLNMKSLKIGTHVRQLIPELGNLKFLEELTMGYAASISNSIYKLSELKILSIKCGLGKVSQRNEIKPDIENLKKLEVLTLESCNIDYIHPNFYKLINLISLDLKNNNIDNLSSEIENMKRLMFLNLNQNRLKSLPSTIGRLKELRSLKVSSKELEFLPNSIGDLIKLYELDIRYSNIITIPDSIGQLSELTSLSICNSRVVMLPQTMLSMTKLEVLNLRGSDIEYLPEWMEMMNLKSLDIAKTKITKLPEFLSRMKNLEKILIHQEDAKRLDVAHEIEKKGIKIVKTNY